MKGLVVVKKKLKLISKIISSTLFIILLFIMVFLLVYVVRVKILANNKDLPPQTLCLFETAYNGTNMDITDSQINLLKDNNTCSF